MKGEWTTCKLSDCCEINPENLKPSWSYSHLRYIDISSVGEGIQTEPFKLIPRADAPSRAQRLVANGDALLSTVRPNRRSMLWLDTVEKNYVASTGFAVLRAKPEKIVPRFLYYTVFNQVFTDYLVTMEKGAAYPAVNVSDIGDAQIVLPSMAEQKRIASILGALDDKIGLNRRMNAKLEDMARTLFKSWFVDFDPVRAKLDGRLPAGMDAATAALFPDAFEESALGLIPKGWIVGQVSCLMTIGRNGIKPNDFPMEIFDHFSLPAFDDGRSPKEELGNAIMSNKFIVTTNSVLISKLNPHIPRIWLPALHTSRRSLCSTEYMVACPKQCSTREYLFSLFTDSTFASKYGTLVTGTTGSHQRIRPESVMEMRVIIPVEVLIQAFTSMAKPLFDRINKNSEESRALAIKRDRLLQFLITEQFEISTKAACHECK